MALDEACPFHPELAGRKVKKVKPVFLRIAIENIENLYFVEEGYLTENQRLWVPSWGTVGSKVPPEEAHVYSNTTVINSDLFRLRGTVGETLYHLRLCHLCPKLLSKSPRSWNPGEKQKG